MPLDIYILKWCLIKLNGTYIKLKVVPEKFSFWRESTFLPNDMKRMDIWNGNNNAYI